MGGCFFGLFSIRNNGNTRNQIFVVEFDIVQQTNLHDIDESHVGVDINGVNSSAFEPAAYYTGNRKKEQGVLDGQTPIQAWIEYDGQMKELYGATKGFKEELGKGGFGNVYKGVLSRSGIEVAVKRVSHGSKKGMREFVVEISSLGRMRHRIVVQLHGWCRRCNDLLLAYEFMPYGSIDNFLFDVKGRSLSWEQRFKILKGIASGLLYLHEEWEQVVVHRDVKASNVLLDGDLNGRLGDFGLSRLYEHGANPKATQIVGSFGYMAPEFSSTWKSSTSANVYSYGALLLKVAYGRRPIEPERHCEEMVLLELVHSLWKDGRILDAMGKRLGNSYVVEEVELVLKLGILCSQAAPESRPIMRQLTQYLDHDASLPDLECQNLVIQDDPGLDQIIV
ncbi:L-type lectin-domain containing receptor kinase IV.2-like [Nymphaea colorata]|nr:L-type lectin-domain containing receptor kinase IV.2-like [Nymphaea colorata]